MENRKEVSQKNKTRTTIKSINPTPVSISEKINKPKQNSNLKRYMGPSVHSSITYNCQGMETT